MAPTCATAAGTTAPTARNLEATATPHDSPSVERATMENVMAGAYDLRLGSPRGLTVCPRPRLKLEDGTVLQRLGFPDVGPHRRFVSALAIDAVGSGVWIPLSMLYFLHQTSLTLVQLGLAMTIANVAV